MMTKTIRAALVTLALATTAACDRIGGRDYAADRADARYQEAVAEYKAGDLAGAAKKLEAALRANPGNASVRFLLATIQQETKDYYGAIWNFREFLVLDPNGEKAAQARTRCEVCEKMAVEKIVSERLGEKDSPVLRENEELRKRNAELAKENAKLKGLVKSFEDMKDEMRRSVVKETTIEEPAKAGDIDALLNGDDDDREKLAAAEQEIAAAGVFADDDRESAPDLGVDAALKIAEDAERETKIPNIKLPASAPAPSLAASMNEVQQKGGANAPARAGGVKEYVVQEGDTLYKLADKFYGVRAGWKTIRDANKATVTPDGRIRAGQKLIIP